MARKTHHKHSSTKGYRRLLDSLEAIDGVHKSQTASKTLQQAYQAGDPSVGIEETMVAMNKASLSVQMLAQARNKVVAAYNDVMNMPV